VASLDDYAWLIGEPAALLLERVASDPRTELQQIDALRRELPAERARLVVEQVALRRRAVDKFGVRAARMFFTRVHLEQATDLWTARYKAMRLGDAEPVADYCCGIGGDLIAFAEYEQAAGWDVSPNACLLARANAGSRATVTCADVATLTPAATGVWHLDPDRRAVGRRVTDLEEYTPGREIVTAWRRSNPNGCVKVAPATDVPQDWAEGAELEWITRDRECRQQVVWLAPPVESSGRRRATVVRREGNAVSFVGDPDVSCDAEEKVGRFILDPDPSLLAANLLGAFAADNNLASLGAGSAYLTGDASLDHGLLSRFEVVECLPLRAPEVASCLAARNVGTLEIKKRGVETDPEAFRRKLKLRGENAATLLLTRIGRREVAIVAERL
jgi:hypothetical protein